MRTKRFIYGLLIILSFLGLSSCQDGLDVPDITRPNNNEKLITLNVKARGVNISQMKSADINTWVYNYNPNPTNLHFVGENTGKKYDISTTISNLLTTGVAISVVPDTYTITYKTEHYTPNDDPIKYFPISNIVDIDINEQKILSTSGNLVLNAKYDDALIIIDDLNYIPTSTPYYKAPYIKYDGTNRYFFKKYTDPDNNDTYQYSFGYYNIEEPLSIYYETGDVVIELDVEKGNIYHIVSSASGNATITMQDMNYNVIAK